MYSRSPFVSTGIALAVLLWGAVSASASEPLLTLPSLQQEAASHRVALLPPRFEETADQITAAGETALAAAEDRLARLTKQDPARLTFESTVMELDRVMAQVRNVGNRLGLLKDVLSDKAARDAANDAVVRLSSWVIGLEYRDDVYRVIRAFADTQPNLTGEDKLLFDEVLRDYRRAGLSLPAPERTEVERLRKELTRLTTLFSRNVVEAVAPLELSTEEAAGLPQSFLDSPGVRQPNGTYRALMNITWHWEALIEHAQNEKVRQKAHLLRYNLAKETNLPLLTQIVALRTDIAKRLGYATWADYQIEPRMAKNATTAKKFEEDLVAGLETKFQRELAELRTLKVEETGKTDAVLTAWDTAYYTDKLRRRKYSVNTEQLRVYFPYDAVLSGMFRVYERIFGLTFSEVAPPQKWAEDLRLFAVKDRKTGEPLGLFYLDMFPRDGKYNHFACFPIFEGGARVDGRYEVPIAALVCNFPPPSAEGVSLLKHTDVETLLHEFGHVMHHVLGRSKHPRHYAFNVPQDFVEAPSQMLENWAWDKAVLDTFAADYRDRSKKVPADVIEALKAARKATSAMFYRRQLSFGVLDLALHMQTEPNPQLDVAALTNAELARVSIAPAEGTAFVAYFGHLCGGYDAGYYGYLWSLAIAQDFASVFAEAPQGLLDETVGRRLRDEIYTAAASREAGVSVEKFLGRSQSIAPFLRFVGAAETSNSEGDRAR